MIETLGVFDGEMFPCLGTNALFLAKDPDLGDNKGTHSSFLVNFLL